MVYIYHSFLTHSSAEGYLGCFHVLAIINSAVMNIGVHVSLSWLIHVSVWQKTLQYCKVISLQLIKINDKKKLSIWWTCLQDSSGDAEIDNRLVDTAGEGKPGMNWESSVETYITICKTDSRWEFPVWCRELKPVLHEEGGEVRNPAADSC